MRRTPLQRRNRIRRERIRGLRPDEDIPSVPPRRYKNGDGYVRLRWLVAPNEYVEDFEHRIVAGRPPADMDVHHLNHIRDDNSPSNLLVCTKEEHGRMHAEIERARALENQPEWKARGFRSHEAATKHDRGEERRAAYREKALRMAERYRAGATTTEIGTEFGLDGGNVSRALRSVGVAMRPFQKTSQRARANGQLATFAASRAVVQARDNLRCVICGKDTKWGGGQAHHICPRGMGGSSDPAAHLPSNLLWLCATCHGRLEREGREGGWAYRLGYLVRHGPGPVTADPDATHLVYAAAERSWYELFPSGVRTIRPDLPPPDPGDVTAALG